MQNLFRIELEDVVLDPRFTRTPCELLKEFSGSLRIYEEVFKNFTRSFERVLTDSHTNLRTLRNSTRVLKESSLRT
jgi:hypothetical protein